MSSILDVIKKRFSARKYLPKKIEENKIFLLKEALRLAPSAKNAQPWKFIFVFDEEKRKELQKACKNRDFISQAPLIVVGVGFPEVSYTTMGGYWNSVAVDVSIAFTQMMLVAKEQGLDTCWIGAFYEDEVKKVLNIPENAFVVSLMTVGYSDGEKKSVRKNADEVISYDVFC